MKVFISHSFEDAFLTNCIAHDLRLRGIATYLAKTDLKYGRSIQDEVSAELRACDEVLVVLTTVSIKSEWVRREAEAALLGSKTIVAVCYGLSSTEMTEPFSRYRAVQLNEIESYYEQLEARDATLPYQSIDMHDYGSNFGVSQNRMQMWQLWTWHASMAKRSILTTTRSAGGFSSETKTGERTWRDRYYQTIQNLKEAGPLDMRLLALADSKRLGELFLRRRTGIRVKVNAHLFDRLEFRYQIVDHSYIVLNIPHVDLGGGIRFSPQLYGGPMTSPTEHCVAFHNPLVAERLADEFEEIWESNESRDLVDFAAPLILSKIRPHIGVQPRTLASNTGLDLVDINEILAALDRGGSVAHYRDRYMRTEPAGKALTMDGGMMSVALFSESSDDRTALRPLTQVTTSPSPIDDMLRECRLFVDKINFDALKDLGIVPELMTQFWPGHTIVTYPFYDDLREHSDLEDMESWIGQGAGPANLFVHIPYCVGICNYCAYAKTAINSTGMTDRQSQYLDAIETDLHRVVSRRRGAKNEISSLYLGGGTPTALPLKHLTRLLETVKKVVGIDSLAEATCEGSPETLISADAPEKLSLLKSWGFTRFSMGVESFSNRIAMSVAGRSHDRNGALEAIETVMRHGFINVNIDLIFGLPGQDIADFVETLLTAVNANVPSITLYPFRVKRKSKWGKTLANDSTSFDWSPQKFAMFGHVGSALLRQKGYEQRSVHWFVKDVALEFRQQRSKYEMHDLLGVGCSAYSYVNKCQFYNIYEERYYADAIRSHGSAIEVGRRLTMHEQAARYLIFGSKRGFIEKDFRDHFGLSVLDFCPEIQKLLDEGLLHVDRDEWNLTETGKLFGDEIGLFVHKAIIVRAS